MSDCIKVTQNGSLLVIAAADPIYSLLEKTLSYRRREYLYGYAALQAGVNVRVIPVQCFSYLRDPQGILPTRMATARGFLARIRQFAEQRGCTLQLTVARGCGRPEVLVPRWEAVDLEFRHRQEEVLRLIAENEYGRIDCPPGFGKSLLIRALCQMWPKARIDVTTGAIDVLLQMYFNLSRETPNVGIRCSKKKVEGCRVMCYSGKSLHHSDGNADVLLVDECHEFGTDAYMQKLAQYRYARRFGFSASQGCRMDDADFELEGAFGPILVKVSYQEAVRHQCVAPIRVQWVDVILDENPGDGKSGAAKDRWAIWRNRERNKIIARTAKSFAENEQVLIVVATVEHAMWLKRLLPEFTLCYSEGGLPEAVRLRYTAAGCINKDEPTMNLDRRIALRGDFETGRLKKVIATSVWNRGVDFKNLSVLIRADAKATAVGDIQIPGRVSRISDDESKEGLVIDFLDQFDRGLRAKARKRQGNYEEQGWRQVFPERKCILHGRRKL